MDVLQYVKTKGSFSTLLMGVGSVCAGTAAAAIRGNLEILPATVCLLFAAFTQLGANYWHAYNNYTKYIQAVPMSRIERLEAEKNPLKQRVLREAAVGCLIFSLMLGLTLMSMYAVPWFALILGALVYGLYGVITYKGREFLGTLAGLLVTFILFGPVGVFGTCLIQTQHEAAASMWGSYDTTPPIPAAILMGLLAINVHLIHSYYANVMTEGKIKYNVSRTLGKKMTIFLVILNGFLSFIFMGIKVFTYDFPQPLIADVPFFLGLALNTYIGLRMYNSSGSELSHLVLLSKANMFLTGFVMLIVWWAVGVPDDSMRTFF